MVSIDKVIELVCRWYVFIFLNIYGIGKIMGLQFYRKGKLPEEIAETTLGTVSSFDLAWTFMGHSYTYILFVGVSQIIGAWMLLWNKTKIFGVAILIPIMVNIVVFDLIFLDKIGAVVNASIYLAMLLLILYINKAKIIDCFNLLTSNSLHDKIPKEKLVKTVLAVLALMAVVFAVDQFFVGLVGR